MIELSLLLPVPPDKEFQRIELYRPCDRTIADEEAIMVRVNVRQFRGFLTLVVVHPFFLTVDHPLFIVSENEGANATRLCPYWILFYFGYAKAKESIGKFVRPKKKNQ